MGPFQLYTFSDEHFSVICLLWSVGRNQGHISVARKSGWTMERMDNLKKSNLEQISIKKLSLSMLFSLGMYGFHSPILFFLSFLCNVQWAGWARSQFVGKVCRTSEYTTILSFPSSSTFNQIEKKLENYNFRLALSLGNISQKRKHKNPEEEFPTRDVGYIHHGNIILESVRAHFKRLCYPKERRTFQTSVFL